MMLVDILTEAARDLLDCGIELLGRDGDAFGLGHHTLALNIDTSASVDAQIGDTGVEDEPLDGLWKERKDEVKSHYWASRCNRQDRPTTQSANLRNSPHAVKLEM